METVRSCETLREWLVFARDVLHLSPQQALSSWVHLRGEVPENEKNVKNVFFFRKACAETPEQEVKISPERRARLFVRSSAMGIVAKVLNGEEVPIHEIRNAPVVILAHDIESTKEGGCKMFCAAPTRFLVEKAFAPKEARVEQTRAVFKNFGVKPATHTNKNFKAQWVMNGQPVSSPPVTSFYNERMGGVEDDWKEDGMFAKPYGLVLDMDAHSLVQKDASRFEEARAMMERENEHGEPLLRQICRVVADVLMEKFQLSAKFLVFTSEGAKPSYRVYVRFAAPEGWTHSRSVAAIFADLEEIGGFLNKTVIKQLEQFSWFCAGMLDSKTFSKGWDRFPGMCKWSQDISKARFCKQEPERSLSDEEALHDWDTNRELCLLTCLALVYDSPLAPLRFKDRSLLKRTHAERITGEREVKDMEMVIEVLIDELLKRYQLPKHNFISGRCDVQYLENGHPFQARFICSKNNTWCPFRSYDIDTNTGMLIKNPNDEKEHEPMGEGKVACFIRLDKQFPCLKVNCFSDRCRKEHEPYFNLGQLTKHQVLRLKRSLSTTLYKPLVDPSL